MTSEKSLPCPFCGATPHHGQMKVEHCQLHGDPFQRYAIWCPKNHARVEGMHEALARTAWNTRATQPLSLTVDAETVDAVARIIDPYVDDDGDSHVAYMAWQIATSKARAILDRLQSLSLPVDIDRSGLAQEVDDISYAGVGP